MAKKSVQVIYDAWDTYVAESADGPAFISFDVQAAREDLTDTLTHCARVFIPIRRPNENGGPVSPEAERLYEMEDELCAALVDERVACRLVGRLTCDGQRQLVFQLDDWDAFRPPVGRWMADHPKYEIDVSEHEGWGFFDEQIRPTPDVWLTIADRRVVRGLLEAGSNPDKKHGLEFVFRGSAAGLRKVAARLDEHGYRPLGRLDYDIGEIVMVVKMALDEADILAESRANRKLAEKHGVEYDGWGAAVVK